MTIYKQSNLRKNIGGKKLSVHFSGNIGFNKQPAKPDDLLCAFHFDEK